jgi:6-phosphofructokinase 1
MAEKSNAIYIMGGGGTPVISASAFGLVNRTFTAYSDKIGTLYAAVGGMRGALNEDITDVFEWVMQDSSQNITKRLNQLKFPATPVFGTSRYNPDDQDCQRLIDVFKSHDIHYVFINGGNDSMEKAARLQQYAAQQDYELHIIGIPKTVDNDLLVTHRCPGYFSFAKQIAINSMSLQADLDAFSFQPGAFRGGPIKEGGVAQVQVNMGRDQGWGAAAAVIGIINESYGPHVILTKDGGFDKKAFLDRCQRAWDRYSKLMVVAAEGAFDSKKQDYLANELQALAYNHGLMFKTHEDPHKNTSVTDSRLGLFLKLLLEKHLGIDKVVYKDFKVREEGPNYLDRDHLEILSAVDFRDAIAVGERAADLAFGAKPVDGIMVTLDPEPGKTGYTELKNVADPVKGSKGMVKPLRSLSTPTRSILTPDGMMVDRDLYMAYAEPYLDLNGPNRMELLRSEGFRLPLERIIWHLEERRLKPYEKQAA